MTDKDRDDFKRLLFALLLGIFGVVLATVGGGPLGIVAAGLGLLVGYDVVYRKR